MHRIAAVLLAMLLLAAPAAAQGGLPAKCLRAGPNGELPTCTQDSTGHWNASYPDSPFADDGGIPGAFVLFAVLIILAGVAFTIWKVLYARQMAREVGMDPNRATAVTLVSDDGLDATYIATSGRAAAPQPAAQTASERLRNLQQLRDDGLITPDEFDARRRAIIDSV